MAKNEGRETSGVRTRSGQYARTTTKRCPMHEPGCAARVIEHITSLYPQPFDGVALVEKQCGRFVRGAHAGQLRGWATIELVEVGGWKRDGVGTGRVVRPGQVLSIEITDFSGKVYLRVAA